MTVNGTALDARPWLTANSLGRLIVEYDHDTCRAKLPGGLRVECDGAQPYWLELGHGYKLSRNCDDWAVEGGSWGWARLTVNRAPVASLLTDHGDRELDRHSTYMVVPLDHIGFPAAWELLRVIS
ncbi:hypothetical protein Lfu02_61670 [Longispora fulva]|uniref:Uncharacterized protein n=1 Tax=Longispora fulva TaxID=619741 RepID=A0A8J7GA71_9ACTN|nr:hypothetical protein [Longispora fulva]MBG6134589.1 hypothetical protein [Longispora fulva]GIG61795.1 hypothetical protein Lfu02_61670 [Longispora fulva]